MKNIELTFKKRLYDFGDYRAFLDSYLHEKKAVAPGFTLQRFARGLGLTDPSSINKILKGQRHPGPEMIESVCRYFQFNEKEERYFRDLLVLSREDKDSSKRTVAEARVRTQSKSDSIRVLSMAEFETLSSWHHIALREAFKLKDFDVSLDWFLGRLRFPIGKREIKGALQNLLQVGLIKKDDKAYSLSSSRFHTTTDIPSEAIRRFHEAMIDLAKTAIRSVPVKERYLSGSTIAVRKDRYEQAKALIEKFQDEMVALCETDSADEVYQLNVQFFPLTQTAPSQKGVSK